MGCLTILTIIIFIISLIVYQVSKFLDLPPHLSYSCNILGRNCPNISQFSLTKESYYEPEFKPVVDDFLKNFVNGDEIGASVAFYYKGKKVVDIAAGYRDYSFTKPYKHDDLQMVYSVSKNLCTLAIAMLVDKNLIKYEDKVSSVWPEFSSGNKENVTIADLAQHSAGLVYFEDKHKLTIEELKDHDKLSKIINQPHNFGGVKKLAYHIATYGFYINEVIRRVDPKKRSIHAFINDEINIPLKTNFKFILTKSEFDNHYAPIIHFPRFNLITTLLTDLFVIDPIKMLLGYNVSTYMMKEYLFNNTCLLSKGSKIFDKDYPMEFTNTFETHTVEMPSHNLKTNAASLAKLAGLIGNKGEIDGVRLLKRETIEKMTELLDPQYDELIRLHGSIKTYGGFGLFAIGEKINNFAPSKNETKTFIGWAGLGGSLFGFNTKQNFGFAYVMNAMGDSAKLDRRSFDLLSKFYDIIDAQEKKQKKTK